MTSFTPWGKHSTNAEDYTKYFIVGLGWKEGCECYMPSLSTVTARAHLGTG